MKKQNHVIWVPCVRVVMAVAFMATLLHPGTQSALATSSYNPNELSYGLYWFGANGDSQKFTPGGETTYFDPARPTLIFIHGWQPYLSQNQPNFQFNAINTAIGWVGDGWNVGIFVWNQFSDETTGGERPVVQWQRTAAGRTGCGSQNLERQRPAGDALA